MGEAIGVLFCNSIVTVQTCRCTIWTVVWTVVWTLHYLFPNWLIRSMRRASTIRSTWRTLRRCDEPTMPANRA